MQFVKFNGICKLQRIILNYKTITCYQIKSNKINRTIFGRFSTFFVLKL